MPVTNDEGVINDVDVPDSFAELDTDVESEGDLEAETDPVDKDDTDVISEVEGRAELDCEADLVDDFDCRGLDEIEIDAVSVDENIADCEGIGSNSEATGDVVANVVEVAVTDKVGRLVTVVLEDNVDDRVDITLCVTVATLLAVQDHADDLLPLAEVDTERDTFSTVGVTVCDTLLVLDTV